jgi:hypothetical protein
LKNGGTAFGELVGADTGPGNWGAWAWATIVMAAPTTTIQTAQSSLHDDPARRAEIDLSRRDVSSAVADAGIRIFKEPILAHLGRDALALDAFFRLFDLLFSRKVRFIADSG